MRKALHAINSFILAACFAAGGFAALALAFPAATSLVQLRLGTALVCAALLAAALLFLTLMICLWRRNEEYGRGNDEARNAALAAPALGVLLVLAAYWFYAKISDMIKPSNAKATIGNLGAMRSALSIYYGDMEGLYPEDFSSLLVDRKYISEIPKAMTPLHPENRDVILFGSSAGMDTGAWGYVNNPSDSGFGRVFVDCTHTDIRGSVWSMY